MNQSIVHLPAGDGTASEIAARKGWNLWEQMHNRPGWPPRQRSWQKSLYAAGHLDDAETAAETVREYSVSDDVEMQSFWRQLQAKIAAHHGEHAVAGQLATEAVALLEPTDALLAKAEAALDRAETLRILGHDPRPDLDRARMLSERKGNVVMANRLEAELKSLSGAFPTQLT